MAPRWKVRSGERVYAIGDIHGRADLFSDLIAMIRQDNATRTPARTRIIVLGDVVDRGPDSAALVARLMRYSNASPRFTVLKGNHEQIMLAAISGNTTAAQMWIKYGGATTLMSWGLQEDLIAEAPTHIIMWQARRCIPQETIRWLNQLKLYCRSGDVLFVHAGVRPGTPLRKQDPFDLMWIREAFLDNETLHPFLVVHGHTIVEDGPDIRTNRIGVDTGAYRTGRLTALGLEGDQIWSLSTSGQTFEYATDLEPPADRI